MGRKGVQYALADDAANVALDGRSDWMFLHSLPISKAQADKTVNYRICVDGAMKRTGASSAGVAINAYYIDGRWGLLLRGGKLLGSLQTSLVGEMMLGMVTWCFLPEYCAIDM